MASLSKSNMDELYADAAKSDNENQPDLLAFLKTEYVRYNAEIQPLYPDGASDNFEDFDEEKNTFLEDLWDVISQYFDDLNGDGDNGKSEKITIENRT